MIKNLPANAGDARDAGSIPGSGRCPGERNGYPFQYSHLENPLDRAAWRAIYSSWGDNEMDTAEPLTLCLLQI